MESIWMEAMIRELEITQEYVKINCDCQCVIHLTNHQVCHDRTKQIDISLHFIRGMIDSKKIEFQKVHLEENPTDMFIKSMSRSTRLKHCLDLIKFVEELSSFGETTKVIGG